MKNKENNKGFVLMIALVLISIVLVVGLGVYDIILREIIISIAGRESQKSFYAADSGIECALYWDVKEKAFGSAESGSETEGHFNYDSVKLTGCGQPPVPTELFCDSGVCNWDTPNWYNFSSPPGLGTTETVGLGHYDFWDTTDCSDGGYYGRNFVSFWKETIGASGPYTISCAGSTIQGEMVASTTSFTLNFENGACARVYVDKATTQTVIISRGYNLDCDSASPKKVERAMRNVY
jgi:hypothetical protein